MSEPTPRPWRRDDIHPTIKTLFVSGPDHQIIAVFVSRDEGEAEADAAYALKAINCHDELVTALRLVADFAKGTTEQRAEAVTAAIILALKKVEGRE